MFLTHNDTQYTLQFQKRQMEHNDEILDKRKTENKRSKFQTL